MTEEQKPYRVLARKYRPKNFDELIGQDALVRTLTNAINSGRIAHAFMLTGIRGTGKTTTARIIAKALNYRGPDGNAGPTTGSTDDCETCKAITEDRHPDVMEMDAASRTGVDDIREILDGVRYAPTSARYKVYIIDEVHMLSKAAFNALLKTLEEPPEHVIFIFATTEIRKVPVTVLSRCQRFDLRRIDAQTLADYYGTICEKEGVKAEKEALLMIGRAADGSVRDGLSLLDQAISLAGMEGSDGITATQVQDMLGLADRTLVLGMLESALKGECGKALDTMAALYEKAADPVVLINDMLDFTHLMTRLRAVPDMKDAQSVMAQDALEAAADLAGKLSMPTLGRAWQILLKGLQEVNQAPSPQAAAEMILIRLAYAADLPDPAELIKKINSGEGNIGGGTPPSGG
ncbi:MAG TPA: DNA polymerase III subunit gamma/tau, partial [Micavibrio sp.]|nr:DNA polymerase III subunit gamma/tau [Micavibrio sp.]